MPDYEDNVKVELLEFLVMIFKLVIGEGKDVISELGSDDSGSIGKKLGCENSNSSDDNEGILEPPIIVCLDNAQNMCSTSWKLLNEIIE